MWQSMSKIVLMNTLKWKKNVDWYVKYAIVARFIILDVKKGWFLIGIYAK